MTIPAFQKHILGWYAKNQRSMPWRQTRDPYKILVSEIMLQQTQVSRVIPKYKEFLAAFPTVQALAKAPEKKLLKVWAGLGYWRRARFLKETAKAVVKNHAGKFPKIPTELIELPGIGPYTAGALSCFAFNNPQAFIDTNIRRVYLHFFFADKKDVPDKEILPIAQKAVWLKDPRTWHYALFDYGATELKDKSINKRSRHYAKQSDFTGSFRSFRAYALKHLLTTPNNKMTQAELLDALEDQIRQAEKDYSPQEIIDSLLKDKLIKQSKVHFFI
ncbi:MAG: A/G-specific adenine glycosylase [Candidatus Andersenbacteria bacterium]|nr:A/G-specific adenine glycosylase [Candidatus Andersenbacteria bacterium]